jgi:pyruvate ferredoxin oxidoreductase alpha subunit
MSLVAARTGNQAVAIAMRQVEPDVCAAYPITPSTIIMETYAQFAADAEVRTELILVESEHSAMSACVGGACAGARVMTATSAQGLALMHEVLYIASGLRLPIVMAVANRALSAPINIHGDHSDAMGSRDAGWIQLYAQDVQEVYDTVLQAVRIAEHPSVRLPVMVCFDGFTISHGVGELRLPDDKAVKAFVGAYRPERYLLDIEHPETFGALVLPDYYIEIKRQQREAMMQALEVIPDIDREFGGRFGRSYGMLEAYQLDDAEVAAVVLGATAGTLKAVVDRLRSKGVKAGLLRIRAFRPFPAAQVVRSLSRLKAIAVLDRADSPGAMSGPLFEDVRAALYDAALLPRVAGLVYGLGGREMDERQAEAVYETLLGTERQAQPSASADYVGLRS